jgi:hypothetical protein
MTEATTTLTRADLDVAPERQQPAHELQIVAHTSTLPALNLPTGISTLLWAMCSCV